MIEHSPEFVDETRMWFETSLNEHGYSFQQTLLKTAQDLCSANKSGWFFQVSEFPVEVRGRGTRIDFVLQRHRRQYGNIQEPENQMVLMVAECKRANPAYSNWCFAKSPYLFRGDSGGALRPIFERMDYISSDEFFNNPTITTANPSELDQAICSHQMVHSAKDIYSIAVEVKTQAKGNRVSGDPGKDHVEQAASQVCQGLNGMVHFLQSNHSLWSKQRTAILLPVIFTTANLWTSDADLSAADIETGNLGFDGHKLESVPWLLFQYHLSPGIKHNVSSSSGGKKSLSDVLKADYIRTIPIVSASGIEDFLRHATALDFNP